MGALTNNRKRGLDYYKSSDSVRSPFGYFDVSKKPRFSGSTDHKFHDSSLPGPSNTVVSRISQYPDFTRRFSREVHAPVRSFSFGHSVVRKVGVMDNSAESSADKGRNLYARFRYAKNVAISSLRHFTVQDEVWIEKEKEVIEIDEDKDPIDVSDDSSVEEVDMVGKQLHNVDSSGITDFTNVDSKVEYMEKMMNLVKIEHDQDASRLLAYKKLYDSAMKRNEKLSRLKSEIELNEHRRQLLQLLHPQKEAAQPKKDVLEECFLPLSEEEEAEVTSALSRSNRRKVLVSHDHSNIDITGEKLQCLCPGGWLNDEIINLYMELMKEREKREPQKFLKCHFFNTFFYNKLKTGKGGYNFQAVRRWTTRNKLGYSLLECDKIFVPIHREIHWCLAVIDKKEEKFQYLDSLGGEDAQVLKVLARYFVDEVKDKNGEAINVSSWDMEFVEDLPNQKNGFDCGLFMLKYADFYSRDLGLSFSQQHMPYFRRRTANEILKLRAN